MNEPQKLSFRQRLLELISLTIQHITITVSCGLCCMLVCILFSRASPWLELSVHFVLHAFVAALIAIPILWFTKHRRTAIVCCIVAFYYAILVQPWIFIPIKEAPRSNSLKILSWNVYAVNEEFDSVVEVIRGLNPDVLVIVEVRLDLLERAPWIKEQYPKFEVIPDTGGAGIGVFCRDDESKYKVDFEIRNFATRSMPSIVATLTNPDGTGTVDLVAMHTYSPSPPQRAVIRDKQIAALLDWTKQQTKPLCLVGDLNTTPWARSFLNLEEAGFRDSRRGTGNCASWPSWLGIAGIPIDHALTLGECTITDRRVISTNAGSDHLPIEFKLSF